MIHSRSPRALRRRTLALLTTAAALAAPAAASAGPLTLGWGVQIKDGVSLGPSDKLPDSVSAFTLSADYSDYVYAVPSVFRAGVKIAGPDLSGWYWWNSSIELADLRDGDVIVLNAPFSNNNSELVRYTYRRALGIDEPICAGQTEFSGTRTPGSTNLFGSSALWQPGKPSNPYGYGGAPDYYPGGGNGFASTNGALAKVKPVGADEFSFDATRPLTSGMQTLVAESYQPVDKLLVNLQVEQTVVTCVPVPGGGGGGGGGVLTTKGTPGSTTKDTAAPKATVSGLSSKVVRKLGRKALAKKGLPLTLTLDEAGTLGGTVTLVAGKRKAVLLKVNAAVKSGQNDLKLRFSKKVQKKLRAASRKGRIRLELTVTDAAGNTRTLPAIAISLPR